jgi:hypothetical protein
MRKSAAGADAAWMFEGEAACAVEDEEDEEDGGPARRRGRGRAEDAGGDGRMGLGPEGAIPAIASAAAVSRPMAVASSALGGAICVGSTAT